MTPHIEELKTRITHTLKRHDIARAAIFGSFARGDAEESSDLDLLVEFRGEKSLFDPVGLKLDLEDSLGRSVDVLTYNALHPTIRDRIISEQVRALWKKTQKCSSGTF